MNKLTRYFLSLMAMGGAYTAPIQANAEAEETPPTTVKSENSFNPNKFYVEAESEDDRSSILEVLQTLNSTKNGKNLLEKMPKNLEFSVVDYDEYAGKYNDLGEFGHKINIDKSSLKNKRELEATLSHEMRHCLQNIEGRFNKGDRTEDGIEGNADFATQKLSEIETNLFDAMEASQKRSGFTASDTRVKCADFYDQLKQKYQNKGSKEEIERAARTEYVKSLWESSDTETKGPDFFKRWTREYNNQVYNNATFDRIGIRDTNKERSTIQKYIDAMEIDLTPDYFLNMKNSHIAQQQREFYADRERQTQQLSEEYRGLSKSLAACSTPLKAQKKENSVEPPHIPNIITGNDSVMKKDITQSSFKMPQKDAGR